MFWRRRSDRSTQATITSNDDMVIVRGGRTFLSQSSYTLPKDRFEESRLDFQHALLYTILGNRHHLAPVADLLRKGGQVLDVGTGTGIWAIEMARQFPKAQFIGVDLKAPSGQNQAPDDLPANYRFVHGDLLEKLPFGDGAFQFIHQRLLGAGIPTDRWPGVVRELARVTHANGYIELIETNFATKGGPALTRIGELATKAGTTRGISSDPGPHLASYLRSAGMRQVSATNLDVVIGMAGGSLGRFAAQDYLMGVTALGALVVAVGLSSEADYAATLDAARRELADPAIESVVPIYIAYGRKSRR